MPWSRFAVQTWVAPNSRPDRPCASLLARLHRSPPPNLGADRTVHGPVLAGPLDEMRARTTRRRLSCRAIAILLLTGAAACAPQDGGPKSPIQATFRPDLDPVRVTPAVRWPPNNGCVTEPVTEVLATGTLLDRFGDDAGTFFSPKGTPFGTRSLPYVCTRLEYRVFRVERPLAVQSCRAAPWFGEVGGGITNKTEKSAAALVVDRSLSVVSFNRPDGSRRPPQCE